MDERREITQYTGIKPSYEETEEFRIAELNRFFNAEFSEEIQQFKTAVESREENRTQAMSLSSDVSNLTHLIKREFGIDVPAIQLTVQLDPDEIPEFPGHKETILSAAIENRRITITQDLNKYEPLLGALETNQKTLLLNNFPEGRVQRDNIKDLDDVERISLKLDELESVENDAIIVRVQVRALRKRLDQTERASTYPERYNNLRDLIKSDPAILQERNHGRTVYITDLLQTLEDNIVDHVIAQKDLLDTENAYKALEIGIIMSEGYRIAIAPYFNQPIREMLLRAKRRLDEQHKERKIFESKPRSRF
jgi:hypothetical protein